MENNKDAMPELARGPLMLGEANTSVLLVDPYGDVKIVTHYALLAESVTVRVLTDAASYKSTLNPAAEDWQKQCKQARPPLSSFRR